MFGRLVYQVKRHVADTLSLERMSGKFHILSGNYIFLMIYATLESVFVNTLLYRITPDISIVVIYRGITYISSAVMMQYAAHVSRKKDPVTVIRLGGALYLAMYIVLFFCMDYMSSFMYLTAILSGAGGAFYWSGHNTLIPHYTVPSNRDIGVSILCIIQGVAALFVPIISGGVISLGEAVFGSPNIGYRLMFGVGTATVVMQILYQRKLPPVEQLVHKSETKLALKLLRKDATFKYMMLFEILRGFRDGTFGFILNMILFEIITSESLVGLNAFLTGVMSIAGAWAYGKLVKPSLRARYAIIATTAMLFFCSMLLIKSSAPIVMIFAMINSFFALFVANSASNSAIDIMTNNMVKRKCLSESLSIREVALTLGRIGGLSILSLFPSTMTGRIIAMIILTATQYVLAILVGKSVRIINRKYI